MKYYVIPEGWYPMEQKPDNSKCRNYMYPDGKKIWIHETWHEFMSEKVVAWQYAMPLKYQYNDTTEELENE